MRKIFRRNLESCFHSRKSYPAKCFAAIEKGDNRLVQEQVNMLTRVEQSNRIPIFFLLLFLLYADRHCHEEEHM